MFLCPLNCSCGLSTRIIVYYQLSIVCSQNMERYTPEGIRIRIPEGVRFPYSGNKRWITILSSGQLPYF